MLPEHQIKSIQIAIKQWAETPRSWWERFKLWWGRRRGYDYCGRCRRLTKWDFIMHKIEEDHPPLILTHRCTECDLSVNKSTDGQMFCEIDDYAKARPIVEGVVNEAEMAFAEAMEDGESA